MINQIEFFEQTDWQNNSIEMVKIDRGNGEFTVMAKAHYDELQAAQAQTAII